MNHLSSTRAGIQQRGAGRPRGQRGQRTRQRLLEAAEASFGSRGYFAASIVDITRRARVAQGTFYIYFPGKRAIFAELLRQRSHELRQTIQEAVQDLHDRREVERAGFEAFFRFIRRHRSMYRIVRQAEFVDPGLFRWYYRRIAEGYVRGLREAMTRGEVRRLDPEVLAYCLMGIGDFVGMRWVLWEPDGPAPRVVDAMMDFLLRGLDGRPQAAHRPQAADRPQARPAAGERA